MPNEVLPHKTPVRSIAREMANWWRFSGLTSRYDFWALYLFLCFLMFIVNFLTAPILMMAADTQNRLLLNGALLGLGVFVILLGLALFAAMVRRIRDSGGWVYAAPLLLAAAGVGFVFYFYDIQRAGISAEQLTLPSPSIGTLACILSWIGLSFYVFRQLVRRSKSSPEETKST